jgi:ribosomal protein S18 acetylase RimI-like enzyme
MGRPVRDPDVVVALRPLRADELPAFVERGREEYRRQLVEFAGLGAQEAAAKAERDWALALTPDQAVYAVEHGERAVGTLWFAEVRGRAYLYEIWVDPDERGRGFGRAAMAALEAEARRRGLRGVEFNVWAGNAVARSLYRSLGYEEQAVFMTRDFE